MDLVYLITGIVVTYYLVCLLLIIIGDCDLHLQWAERFGKSTSNLAGKVVWITGASSGIGEYLAYELAKAGCRLVLSARREGELERVKKQCLLHASRSKLKEDDIFIVPLDCLKFDTHQAAVDKVLEQFKQVDILVNNAGRSQRAEWAATSLDVDKEMLELNVLGVLSLTKKVLPHMLERKQGHIVNMSSLAGKVGIPGSGSYCGAKHAIQGLFDSLRAEVSQTNIQVTNICPGPVFSNNMQTAFTGNSGEGWFDGLRPEVFDHNINVTNICPGPVFSNILETAFTAAPGAELKGKMMKGEKRMSTSRCAELSSVAIANKLDEVWIALNPVLLFTYLPQYFPNLSKLIIKRTGKKVISRLREGKL